MNPQAFQALPSLAATLTDTAEQLRTLDQTAHPDELAAAVRNQLGRLQGVIFALQAAVALTEPRRLAPREPTATPLPAPGPTSGPAAANGGVVRQLTPPN